MALADVAAGLAGILHALTPGIAPGLPYTQHPDDAPEPLENVAATRSRLFSIRWPGSVMERPFVALSPLEYPNFYLRSSVPANLAIRLNLRSTCRCPSSLSVDPSKFQPSQQIRHLFYRLSN